MTAPSNANTSGLEVVAWRSTWTGLSGQPAHELHHQEAEAIRSAKWMESATFEPLVTAASAQARIDAAEARADRLSKGMPDLSSVIGWLANGCDPTHAVTELRILQARIDHALQQETQK